MTINKLAIYSATQKSNPEETSLWKSLKKLDIDVDLNFYLENDRPLTEVYNECLKMVRTNIESYADAVIFVHDDVWLEEDPIPKLEELFEAYDLVGVAGASEVKLESPALWHIMGSWHLHGRVQHLHDGKKYPTEFGPYPHRVVLIDGVFMAFSKSLINSEFEFDENNPSKFHFYDLIASMDVNSMANMKVGVGDILITHESPGLREFTPDWKAGEQFFLQKYGN